MHITGTRQVDNLSVEYARQGDVLRCRADGRIDTISAPLLMEIIDTQCEGLGELQVDAEKLEYISSAGLRVLMLAVKKLGDGSVEVINASDGVKETFATTGFDEFIRVS